MSDVQAGPSDAFPGQLNEDELRTVIFAALRESVAGAPAGTVPIVHTQATWRFIAAQVVVAAEIDDLQLFEASHQLAAIDVQLQTATGKQRDRLLSEASRAEARVDVEFERVLHAHGLLGMVGRLFASVTTGELSEAAR